MSLPSTGRSGVQPGAGHRRPDLYDEIGRGYARHRRPDARIAAQLRRALGDAERVCNVGAGTGSYEPDDRRVVAVEPSREMLGQRDRPAVRGVAEGLPFRNDAFDAALAILTVHHWRDPQRGLAELCRVARRQVIFAFVPDGQQDFWLVRDYFPALRSTERGILPIDEICACLGTDRVEVIPVPHDCTDGFQAAYWRRPERYLEPDVRACISSFAKLTEADVAPGLRKLAQDLEDGTWHARNAALLEQDSADWGYRLVISE